MPLFAGSPGIESWPFETAPVTFTDGLVIVALGAVLVVVEIQKRFRLGWCNRQTAARA